MKVNEFTPDTSIFKKISSDMFKEDSKNTEDAVDNVSSFGNILKDKLSQVNSDQIKADESIDKFIKGDDVDIHDVMLDVQQAKMSLELAVQIRNKFIDAYEELNRTQI
ncbi:flagellar hook-basal body complex protein FliE [Clostridium sp. cel8]|jgi:flagellar hook-basal body complex protein FliE|uniref:flagellar hook-basal body complex protein FliE n=1 Tax=unclassified Clostridium TaxID=2614128 RepID=UPI0015F4046A|nr:flagellar hook-basal body complex protein FliE [Clostridium sp. cel8]MBA5851035.1 flagellar hook-basal body complex protein FliE [Clostridium sp. cel8]